MVDSPKPASLRAIGIIPARYGATRLPGKPLVDLRGKSMIQRVWEGARQATTLERVIVATDDERIAEVCVAFGAEAVMTAPELPSGTDRILAAYRLVSENLSEKTGEHHKYDVVVNIQGDEPLLRGSVIDALLQGMAENWESTDVATPVKKMTDAGELSLPSVVKVAVTRTMHALYFSRSPIPFMRDAAEQDWLTHGTYWKHIGIYAYKTPVLMRFGALPSSVLERTEQLEQLRLVEDGARFLCVETAQEFVAIDTPEDVVRVQPLLV